MRKTYFLMTDLLNIVLNKSRIGSGYEKFQNSDPGHGHCVEQTERLYRPARLQFVENKPHITIDLAIGQ